VHIRQRFLQGLASDTAILASLTGLMDATLFFVVIRNSDNQTASLLAKGGPRLVGE
jgi:hypothetical protein